MIRLAAPTIDIGLFSDNPAMPNWYRDVLDAPLVEVITHSPTYTEQFYAVGQGCLKINYSTEPMPPGTSGYRGLLLTRSAADGARRLTDPDGLGIRLVDPEELGGADIGVEMGVPEPARQAEFMMQALGATEHCGRLRVGDALFYLDADASATKATPTWSRGFNYYVLFVEDGPAAHRQLVEAGAEHGLRPMRLGDRCIFSWLRDPSGNWFELVQRAEADRPLEPVDLAADNWEDIIRWRSAGTPA